MIFGSCHIFCVLSDVAERYGADTYLALSFNVGPHRLGDPDDWAWAKHVAAWTRDVLAQRGTRVQPELDGLTAEDVFARVFDAQVITIPKAGSIATALGPEWPVSEPYGNWRQRFLLDDLGDAAFRDHVNILLFETTTGEQRLIWRDLDEMVVREAYLPARAVESALESFLSWVETL